MTRASLFALHAMFFLAFAGEAYACMESDSFKSRIRSAELIFEGHVVRYEKHEIFKRNEKYFPSFVNVYVVDKNLKGAKKGQEVKVIGWNRAVEEGEDLPEPPESPINTILVLESKATETPEIMYRTPMCPDGIFKSPEQIEYFRENFRATWLSWTFYSVKRWVSGLI